MMLFINKMFLLLYFIDTILHERMLIFNSQQPKAKNGLHSMYFITVNKYRFCISVIGYINVQSIGIGYKKSISFDH